MPYKDVNKRREVNRKSQEKWYAKNKGKQTAMVQRRKKQIHTWLKEFKSKLSCVRCGESHPACLDFHHKNPSQKNANISNIASKGWGIKRILLEIEKCIVLCANCHRKEHFS